MLSERPSVLLIEDDPAIAELYTFKLRLDGFKVDVAADAATAEVIFEKTRPDLVCVDNRLPDAAGTDVVSTLSRRGAAVVLLTNDDSVLACPPPEARGALLKSRTSPGELSHFLRRLLDSVRARSNQPGKRTS